MAPHEAPMMPPGAPRRDGARPGPVTGRVTPRCSVAVSAGCSDPLAAPARSRSDGSNRSLQDRHHLLVIGRRGVRARRRAVLHSEGACKASETDASEQH